MPDHNSLRQNAKDRDTDAQVRLFASQHREVILPFLTSILEDGFNQLKEYGYTDYQRDLASLKQRYNGQGLGFIQVTLPNLINGLFRFLETGISSYPEFSLQKGTSHPRFMRKLFVMIYDHTTTKKSKATAIKIIYQLCAAFSKLEGPYSSLVLRKELADFVTVDRDLARVDFNHTSIRPVTEHARSIITNLFKGSDKVVGFELPSPGSGATNTPVEKNERYRPQFLYHQLNDAFDHDIWFNTSYQYLFGGEAVNYGQQLLIEKQYAEYPCSRFKFINKKLGKPRGICIEENETQYFQQGLRKFIYEWIETHPKTKGKINFTDQNINRDLALSSSLDQLFATIDMSEASDRVIRELVLYLFLHSGLFEKLEAVSTKFIQLPPGLGQHPTLLVNKFAPMGSGVCFPIMGIVHWALITSIIYCSNIANYSKLSQQVYVYGDDIIVPAECADLVYKILPKYGMKINVEKSYVNSHFRESCGCHAFAGYDITPAFIKKVILNTSSQSDSSLLVSLISKEERLRKNGFLSTASLIRKQVHEVFGELPTVHADSSIVGWKTDDLVPKHRLMPYCKGIKTLKVKGDSVGSDPQQILYKFRVAVTATEQLSRLEDDTGYLRKQTMLTRDSRDVRGDPDDVRIVWKWIPEPALACDLKKVSSLFTKNTMECVPSDRVRQMSNHCRGVIAMPVFH